jgi:hypothetical protein
LDNAMKFFGSAAIGQQSPLRPIGAAAERTPQYPRALMAGD